MKPWKSCFQRTLSRERREAERQTPRSLVAYYWDGAAPVAHSIRNASSTGIYLLTEQRWYPGTMITMTLQKANSAETDPDRSITVKTKVVRSGADGVGLAFVLPATQDSRRSASSSGNEADRKMLERFLHQLMANKGQALIEYILLLPMVFLLIVNVVNMGGFFYAWITVANAARAGADYAVLGGASVGSPGQTTATQINNLITQDVSSLPNNPSLSVNICQNNNGTITTLAGTCSSVPSDPEQTNYVLTTIDVTYTYKPFIPAGFKFPNLNVYVTIPPSTVHRRAVMRLLQ